MPQRAGTCATQVASTRLLPVYKESRSRPRNLQGAGIPRGRTRTCPAKSARLAHRRSAAKNMAGLGAFRGKCRGRQRSGSLDAQSAAGGHPARGCRRRRRPPGHISTYDRSGCTRRQPGRGRQVWGRARRPLPGSCHTDCRAPTGRRKPAAYIGRPGRHAAGLASTGSKSTQMCTYSGEIEYVVLPR